MTDTAVDFLLENLMQLINCEGQSVCFEKEQLQCLYQELQFLRGFLKDSEMGRNEHQEVMDLVSKIRDVTFEAEDVIDSFLLYSFIDSEYESFSRVWRGSSHMVNQLKLIKSLTAEKLGDGLGGVLQQIESVRTEVMQLYEKKTMYGIGVPQNQRPSHGASSTLPRPIPMVEEGAMVDLEDEKTKIMELLLAGECEQELKLFSISGMPGLGKTTMATTIYNDPLVTYHFHIRAWTCVSQVCRKRDLLLSIFRSGFPSTNETCEMSDEKLGEELYKRLKGRRYLIVMDDVWDSNAWDDLRMYFPNDKNGSRILFTSRLVGVPLHAKAHPLRSLDEDESWDLFQRKIFGRQSCTPELMEFGKQIVKKCGGLPLAILAVSGILAKMPKEVGWWRYIVSGVSKIIVSDPELYMETLSLSYNHLPCHLKACFLYFGAFPEDYIIPVWKLMCLWVAEGFIPKNEQKSLEEVAEQYLIDLIERNLVIVSEKKSDGRAKTCKIHDLLREVCLRKAKEDNFLLRITSPRLASFPTQRRLCAPPTFPFNLPINDVKPCYSALYIRSFLAVGFHYSGWKDASSICEIFKLLRVLDVSSIGMNFFPSELQLLVHLRYLALQVIGIGCELEISKLCSLETLIVEGSTMLMQLPSDILKMVKLRHLCIKAPFKIATFSDPFILGNLQSIRTLYLCGRVEEALKLIPNLRKLKCHLLSSLGHFPKLDSLIHLETLNVRYRSLSASSNLFPHVDDFPIKLKCLTLSRFRLPWEEMSTLGRLPNLEVLKVLGSAFEGPRWDTNDGEFRKLRFLKLSGLNIKQWNASSDHFPRLQSLVLNNCNDLMEIPLGLGDIATLEVIQVQWCSPSATRSAEQIEEQQRSLGNDELKILIHYPSFFFEWEAIKHGNEETLPCGYRRKEPSLPPTRFLVYEALFVSFSLFCIFVFGCIFIFLSIGCY